MQQDVALRMIQAVILNNQNMSKENMIFLSEKMTMNMETLMRIQKEFSEQVKPMIY